MQFVPVLVHVYVHVKSVIHLFLIISQISTVQVITLPATEAAIQLIADDELFCLCVGM
jgi:hypothetical protein